MSIESRVRAADCCEPAQVLIAWHERGLYVKNADWYLEAGVSPADDEPLYIKIDYCPWCGKKLQSLPLEMWCKPLIDAIERLEG